MATQTIKHTGATNTTSQQQPPKQQQQGSQASSSSGTSLLALPTVWGFLGIQQVNWSDILIRGGLVLVGVVLIFIIVAKMLEHPAVEIATAAATEGGE